MFKALIVFCITLFSTFAVQAADCASQAADKKLSGAAKASFLKKCVATDCTAQAGEKKLAGAAQTSFTTKCVADGLAGYCEDLSTTKKLSGAVKTSFLKKCQSGK